MIDLNIHGVQFWHRELPREGAQLSPAQAELWDAWRDMPASTAAVSSIAPGANGRDFFNEDPPPTPPSSSSSTSSDEESDDPDPKDSQSSDDSRESRKQKKKKEKGKGSSKAKIRRKMHKHIQKFQSIRQGFDDKVLDRNPMDVVGAIYNLRLQVDKDTVAYAKREKISSLKELRANVMKDAPSVINTTRAACKAEDATLLKRAVEEAISQLTLDYYDLTLDIIIVMVMHSLSETQGADFADRRRSMRTLILEAMLTPLQELGALYIMTKDQGKPPRKYQHGLVATHQNIWHACGIINFGPLSSDPVRLWVDLKDAVVELICRQVVPQVTFAKCLEDFKHGKWFQKRNQSVSKFEGEFLSKESALRFACEHDGKDQSRHMPCPEDRQQLFISKILSDVKAEAHVMLSERRAEFTMNVSLEYANCRFEDLLPEHFLKPMMLTETIMRKREASRPGNLGTAAPRYDKYQGRDLHLPEGSKNRWHREGEGTKWQRKELNKEIKSNATVAIVMDIADLQEKVGDYQNTTKYFTKKNKVYCAPIREHAQAMCKHCDKSHYIDTPCKGGDTTSTPPARVAMHSSLHQRMSATPHVLWTWPMRWTRTTSCDSHSDSKEGKEECRRPPQGRKL